MKDLSLYSELRKEYLKTWRIWYAINQRCDPQWRKKHLPNPKKTYFAVVDEWSIKEFGEEGFINFFDCVGDLEHVEDLHRIDPNKPYGPRNIERGTISDRIQKSSLCTNARARWLRVAENNGVPRWEYYRRLDQGLTHRQAATRAYKRQRNYTRNAH